MAIYVDKKNIVQVFAENKAVAAIYAGAILVWQAVRSCFGAGFWVGRKPWLYKEGWRYYKK